MEIMGVVSVEDLFNFAIKAERKGEELYARLSQLVKDTELQSMFNFLAEAESDHARSLREEMSKINMRGRFHDGFSHLSELVGYLNDKIFSPNYLKQKLKNVKDMESLFEFAMGFELDMVLFYQEMKPTLSINDQGFVDDLITQERGHFVHLMQLKRMKDI